MDPGGNYKRNLPSPPAINFYSDEGRQLFTEALADGQMMGFFKLISYFHTQSEPAYCGLASLTVVLNALEIDPCRIWKGTWRWFDEEKLDYIVPLEEVKEKGITFATVVCLGHCVGADVRAYPTSLTTLEEFRRIIVACTSSNDTHVVSSYNRRGLRQIGSGHFSPIGGYHRGRDMVLILDVARFKYPPHWVPLADLWGAMDTIDEASNSHRGFMVVSSKKKIPPSSSLMVDEGWLEIGNYVMKDIPRLLSSTSVEKAMDALLIITTSLPSSFTDFIRGVVHIHQKEYGVESNLEVHRLVEETSLYTYMINELPAASSMQPACKELTELLFALPDETWNAIQDVQVCKEVSSLVSIQSLSSLLRQEVLHIRGQLGVIQARLKDGKQKKKRSREPVV